MSQEIKNTLFRFVTMRAPELSNEENQEKRFVKKPSSNTVSSFDTAVKVRTGNSTKWSAMKNHASSFVAIKTTEEVKVISSKLYEFAIWLARNKYSYTNTELISKKNVITSNLNPENINKLWDNLFYQVVTNKDFYVKEAIIQMLVANNLIENFVNDSEIIEKLVTAKVVLPKELFVEDEITPSTTSSGAAKAISVIKVDTSVESLPSEEMKEFQAISIAEIEIESITRLKAELKNAEKVFAKGYQEAIKVAQESHQENIKPILSQYAQAVEESKKNWCTIQNQEIPYDPVNPCNQPPVVPYPDLPKFEFEYPNEINIFHLQENLSEESFETLTEIFNVKALSDRVSSQEDSKDDSSIRINTNRIVAYNDFSSYDSYIGLYSNLDSLVSQNNQTIINNTPNQQPRAISLGGVIIPTVTAPPKVPFTYQICPRINRVRIFRTSVDFDVSFDVPDTSWQVLSVETKYLITGRSEQLVTAFSPVRTGNTIFFRSLLTSESLSQSNLIDGSLKYVSVTVTFSNGAIKTFKTGTWNSTNCFFGTFIDVKTLPDGGSTSNTTENSFIPTGFGVKQLGIADYKKVEQSLQGYVDGEVAHIENIMARQYKEKATRKLRRSENTTTTSSETEREQLSDTTSTSRFEMQSEVASVIQEGKDFGVQASVSYSPPTGLSIFAGTNFASHSSKEESNRQAVTQAKDITERAMERVVTKVKEERIQKIVEEFEENNKHGFDNTKGDKHVVGVFRWVDKVYKNQVINYGKRLMFEFMIPEPAKLHILGMSANKSLGTIIEKPIDPRTATSYKLSDYSLVNETTIKYWGSKFNVEIESMPAQTMFIGKSFSNNSVASGGFQDGHETFDAKENLKIPEGYYTKNAQVTWASIEDGDWRQAHGLHFGIGNLRFIDKSTGFPAPNGTNQQLKRFEGEIPLSVYYLNSFVFNATASIECERTPEYYSKWQQETFNAIIDAYKEALVEYNQVLAEEKAKGDLIKSENPGFYRQIENVVLRKNCISYLVSQDQKAKRTYGQNMSNNVNSFGGYEITPTATLDDYAAFAKFIEQAFEWDIMSYNFYPYYWGKRDDWASLYQYDNNDPLFRSFMQSGMARVIVTVRPGFEEAVSYYMQTGQIWNGGEVPVIEDKLFLSIIDELRQPTGVKEGKAWPTRIPTALTILQADSIGLKVTKALPYDDDLSDFENPDDVPQQTGFEVTGSQLNNTNTKFIEFTFEGMDSSGFRTIGEHDDQSQFPRVYECMGQTITINRDAKWLKTTSSIVIFDELADQLALLNGIKARVAVSDSGKTDGITFTVDTSKIKEFIFKKPGQDPLIDSLKVTIEDEVIVKIGKYNYPDNRIQDKGGVALDLPNTTNLFPISRFEI